MKVYPVPHNTAWLTGASVTQKILSFGYFWYLTAHLDKESLGAYLFALSFATLFGSVTDIGITPVLIRETARDPQQGNRYVRAIASLKLILGLLAVAAAVLIINLSGRPLVIRHLVYAALAFVFLDAFTLSFWGIFKAARNLRYESIATVVVQLVIIAGGAAVLLTTKTTLHLVFILVSASIVNFAMAAFSLRRALGYRLAPSGDFAAMKFILRLVPAFAFSLLFVKIYNVADTVLLGYLADNAAVAHYAIPAKVVTSLQQVVPATFVAVLFPVFAQAYREGGERISWLLGRACAYLAAVSVPLTVGLVLLTSDVLQRVWPNYREVAPAFAVMALALPFIFLAFPTGYLLNATDRQARNTCNRGLVMAAAIVANLWLIPSFGYLASAAVFTGANIMLLTMDAIALRGLIRLRWQKFAPFAGKLALAAAAMAGAIVMLRPRYDLFVVIVFSGGVYVAMAALLRLWRMPGLNARRV